MSRVLELLREHGVNATSFQTLEPGLRHWMSAGDDACVAYVDTGRSWVALGEPIAPPARSDEVVAEFVEAARAASRRPRFFALEAPAASSELSSIKIGEQPLWEPARWPDTVASSRSLREQLRRARANGVVVTELDGAGLDAAGRDGAGLDSDHRAALAELAARWKASRTMAPMRFAVTLDLFGHAAERRYFVAERDGELIAALIAVPIYARDGWLIEDLLRDDRAPNGTIELLFDAAMRSLADRGAAITSMGMAPLSGVEARVLQRIAQSTRWLFDFGGLRAFKAKLRPQRWEPVYAAYPRRERGVSAVLDILRAFADGPLSTFAWRTLLHRRRAVLWLLAVLLIPWTALLATPAAARFFPDLQVQAGWLIYDAALFFGLASLARRWSRPLAHVLALGAGLDAVVGAGFVAAFNAERAAGLDWLAVSAAIAAPVLACGFLLAALRNDRR